MSKQQSTNGSKIKETKGKKTTNSKSAKAQKDKKPLTAKQKKSMAIWASVLGVSFFVGKGISDGDIANPITEISKAIDNFNEAQAEKAKIKAWESEKIDDGTGTLKARYGITRLMYASNAGDALENLISARAINPDAVAWINIPDTDINGALMQGMDNDYYLRRDENGDYDIYGCYFLDYECPIGSYDDYAQNTVIYGHSDSTDNPNGKRFAQLYRFTEDEFADTVKEFTITTLNGHMTVEIFACFYTSTDLVYNAVNITPEHKLDLVATAKSLSIRDYDVLVDYYDKIVTLSTCTVLYGNDNTHRFVVMGRIVQ